MGVYIDMEMPQSCRACLFRHETYLQTRQFCIANSNEELCTGIDKIDESCPLVPVPPHGRLIDADALIAAHKQVCSRSMKFSLDLAPTIIPAEPSEEQREYEAQVEAAQYCEMYEPSYDPETGAL